MALHHRWKKAVSRWLSAGPSGNVVRLQPRVPVQGRAILSFSTNLYKRLLRGEAPISSHPAAWTNLVIARSLLDRGMLVDVIDWDDSQSEPEPGADLIIDVAQNLERLGDSASRNAERILYAMFACATHHNALNAVRHEALYLRRGFSLPPTRRVRQTRSAEVASQLILPGGRFSEATFAGCKARMHRIPQARPAAWTLPTVDNTASRRNNFLWMAGQGAVHKGLDLTLEAFAELPEHQLHVLADLGAEPAFRSAYARELKGMPNIHHHGFVDANSDAWLSIAGQCSSFLTTSCCEVRNTAALACMRSGLIPILTAGADIDAPRSAIRIDEHSVAAFKDAIRAFSGLGSGELECRSRAAREEVEVLSGRSTFVSAIAGIMDGLIGPLRVAGETPDLNRIIDVAWITQLSS